MGLLKWFNKQKYSGLGDVLSDIRRELEALQPQDSTDIVWSKSANGVSAKFRGNTSASEMSEEQEDVVVSAGELQYKGAFAVRHVEGFTFEVYNGAYPEADPTKPHSMIAGYTDLPGAETFYRQEITITRDCTISLAAACVDGVYSAFLSTEPSPTVDEKVFDYTALASVTLSGKVTQHFTESRIYFGRYWFL